MSVAIQKHLRYVYPMKKDTAIVKIQSSTFIYQTHDSFTLSIAIFFTENLRIVNLEWHNETYSLVVSGTSGVLMTDVLDALDGLIGLPFVLLDSNREALLSMGVLSNGYMRIYG